MGVSQNFAGIGFEAYQTLLMAGGPRWPPCHVQRLNLRTQRAFKPFEIPTAKTKFPIEVRVVPAVREVWLRGHPSYGREGPPGPLPCACSGLHPVPGPQGSTLQDAFERLTGTFNVAVIDVTAT